MHQKSGVAEIGATTSSARCLIVTSNQAFQYHRIGRSWKAECVYNGAGHVQMQGSPRTEPSHIMHFNGIKLLSRMVPCARSATASMQSHLSNSQDLVPDDCQL